VKTKTRKLLTGIFLLFVTGLVAVAISLWGNDLMIPRTETFSPHYLLYQGTASKIYLVSATSAYTSAKQKYFSNDGYEVPSGNRLFMINVVLRNDYTNENPPPSMDTPISPVDGTAYICLNFTLHSKGGTVSAINVTPSDFSPPSTDQTGLVLASGQTNTIDFYFATNRTDISQFEINLVCVSDSIQC
jgi:hypothetical protein